MSEHEGLGSLTSKKGWADIGYNQSVWIPLPAVFAPGVSLDRYAADVAKLWWEASGLKHSKVDVARLRAIITETHKGVYGKIPCHLVFIHLPDPRRAPLILRVGIWEATGDKDEMLRSLTRADNRDAVERPVAEEFVTQRLGTGLRVMRYRHLPDGALYAGLCYALRSEEYETDLLFEVATEDLASLERAIGDIQEFVQAATVIPQPSLPSVPASKVCPGTGDRMMR